ncbi:hypothetical protein ES708_12189 [subsurface metagenome]
MLIGPKLRVNSLPLAVIPSAVWSALALAICLIPSFGARGSVVLAAVAFCHLLTSKLNPLRTSPVAK